MKINFSSKTIEVTKTFANKASRFGTEEYQMLVTASIVHRMSDDISSKKERYRADIEAFEHYLNKVYFQRMSAKMVQKVFKAFWKFTFIKTSEDGEVYQKDRFINRKTLEAMLL